MPPNLTAEIAVPFQKGSHIAAYRVNWKVAIAESRKSIRSNQWPFGKVMNSLRLSLTGSQAGIAEIIYTIGLQELSAA